MFKYLSDHEIYNKLNRFGNESEAIKLAQKLCEIKEKSFEEMSRITFENAKNVYRIK